MRAGAGSNGLRPGGERLEPGARRSETVAAQKGVQSPGAILRASSTPSGRFIGRKMKVGEHPGVSIAQLGV